MYIWHMKYTLSARAIPAIYAQTYENDETNVNGRKAYNYCTPVRAFQPGSPREVRPAGVSRRRQLTVASSERWEGPRREQPLALGRDGAAVRRSPAPVCGLLTALR